MTPDRDPLTSSKRGLLFVVLGLIMAQQPDKAIGEDSLFQRLIEQYDLPDGACLHFFCRRLLVSLLLKCIAAR